jgi:hypothetical protein
MCTLSFLPTVDGYLAAMNRDELLTRRTARPPEILQRGQLSVIRPIEPAGGTWIACNSRGILLALLNWNDIPSKTMLQRKQTRGAVIPQLIWHEDSATVHSCFGRMPLDQMLPFRLVGIFRDEAAVFTWQWDGIRTARTDLPWVRRHWFSSSLSDAQAAAERGAACEEAARAYKAATRDWLRSLHASHLPFPGAFSICVHRDDAATVSYTEVCCRGEAIAMDYFPRNPCKAGFAKAGAGELGRNVETFSGDRTLT